MAIPIFEEVMNGVIFSFGKGRRLLKVGTMEVDGLGGIDDDDADDDQNQDDGDEYIGDGHQDDDGDGKCSQFIQRKSCQNMYFHHLLLLPHYLHPFHHNQPPSI